MKALYRIVNGLLAALIFPAALFLDFIFIQVSTTLVDAGIEESISLKRIIDIFAGKDRLSQWVLGDDGAFEWPAGLDPIKGKLIGFAVFFALVVIAAVFIIVWSCCSNKHLPVFIAGTAGIIFSIIMIICFNSAAKMITSGAVNLVNAIAGNGIIMGLLGGIVNVDTLVLGGFHNAFIIIMAAIALWSAAFFLVDLGADDKEPKKK